MGDFDELNSKNNRLNLIMAAIALGAVVIGIAYMSVKSKMEAKEREELARLEAERRAAEQDRCKALIDRVQSGKLTEDDRANSKYGLLIRVVDGGLSGDDLSLKPGSPFPCGEIWPQAREAVWESLVSVAITSSEAWSEGVPSTAMVKAVGSAGGLDAVSLAAFSKATDTFAAELLAEAKTSSQFSQALSRCEIAQSLGANPVQCFTVQQRYDWLLAVEEQQRAAEQARRAQEEAERRRQEAARKSRSIESALNCLPGCLNSRPNTTAALDACTKQCSQTYGLSKSDWQNVFVENCSPPPTSDYYAARCVMFMSFAK